MKIKLNGNNKLILQTKIYQNKLNGNPEKSPLYSFSFPRIGKILSKRPNYFNKNDYFVVIKRKLKKEKKEKEKVLKMRRN